MCFGSFAPVCGLSRLLSPGTAKNLWSYHDHSACQDRHSMHATMLKIIRRRVTILEKVLGELHMVRSVEWEVMADLIRTAFGTPVFSQHPERGYLCCHRKLFPIHNSYPGNLVTVESHRHGELASFESHQHDRLISVHCARKLWCEAQMRRRLRTFSSPG
jgi:hypothetical protein